MDDVVKASQRPATVASLTAEIAALGIQPGDTVVVHASLSRLGWVAGGAQAVVLALEAVTGHGTLVMPTHSSDYSDPVHWSNPPVPAEWIPIIQAEMPAFDPALTPTLAMGAIAECFRHLPGVLRSNHPTVSFAARGPLAGTITADHQLAEGLGERSPLARLYDVDAWVLLLGVDHASNTSLHLAEYRADIPRAQVLQGSPVMVEGQRRWVEYAEIEDHAEDFASIGEGFAAASGAERRGPVGSGLARLARQRDLVDYAVGWLERRYGDSEAAPPG